MVRKDYEWKSTIDPNELGISNWKKNGLLDTGAMLWLILMQSLKLRKTFVKFPMWTTSEMDICEYVMFNENYKSDRPYNAFKIFALKHKLDTYLDDNY